MSLYLLRVEGVNLVNVIDDTDDLSTRRGGGLMILNAAAQLPETLQKETRDRLRPVATGASIGLFSFEAADENDAEAIRAAVESHFGTGTLEYPETPTVTGHLPLKHGTFVVDVEPMGQSPAEANQMVLARNRWRQMRSPSLSLDGLWSEEATEACEFDFVRPGSRTVNVVGEVKKASTSVSERRTYGRGARQKFYEQELGSPERGREYSFVDDFEALADPRELGPEHAPPDTHDKLAVFYVDGNQFGEIGRKMWASKDPVAAFRDWSEKLRKHHRWLLSELLARASADDSWKYDKGRLRLETLLWGGDEILWVVPAWKGWELARWFFGLKHEVTVLEQKRTLTYSAGLVFCHRNAPIKNIKELAHRLGDLAKHAKVASPHLLAYEVLESFDDVPGELDVHRRRWLPKGHPVEKLVLNPAAPETFWESLRQIAASTDFPMRQLYMLVKAWREQKPFESHKKRLDDCGAGAALTAIHQWVNDDAAWLHLLQMLPFIPTASPSPPAGGAQ